MNIIKTLHHGVYDVRMQGKFTFTDHPEFRDILVHISQEELQKVVFHMEEVDFVDSAALGMLLLAHDEAEKFKKELIIKGVTGQVKKMLGMARFHTFITMVEGD